MDVRMISSVARRWASILSVAGMLAALAILSLAFVASAQSLPVRVRKTASSAMISPADNIHSTAVFTNYLPFVIRGKEPEPPPPTQRLAYASNPGSNYEIFAVNVNGTDLVNVSNQSGGDADPKWSPDGSKIAWVHFYDGTGDIFVANADGSSKTNLTNYDKEDRGPDWSPDGSKIVFYRLVHVDGEDKWDVYVMDANGANLTRLTNSTAPNCQSHDPVWSPDGSKIAYICGLNAYAEVYVMNADGSNQTRLTYDDTSLYREDASLSWSPDSTRLVYAKYHHRKWKELQGVGDIYVVNVTSAVIQQLTFDNDPPSLAPQWSPDGSRIAFSKLIDANYEIATMNPDGSNVVNLTRIAKGDFGPRWSPDGLRISFTSNRDGNMKLFVMDANGNNQFQLTTTGITQSDHDWRPQ